MSLLTPAQWEDSELTEHETENEQQSFEADIVTISNLKKDKHNAKSLLTRLLATLLSVSEPERQQICELLQQINEQQEATLCILDQLETTYEKITDRDNAMKIGDKADRSTEQVDRETVIAREFLASLAKKSSNVDVVMSKEARIEQQRIAAEITKEKRKALLAEKERLHEAEEMHVSTANGLKNPT